MTGRLPAAVSPKGRTLLLPYSQDDPSRSDLFFLFRDRAPFTGCCPCQPNLKRDYAKVDVRGALEPVVILCRIHGPFAQRPANHLLGLGCTRCSQEERRIPVDVVEAEVRARYPHYALKRDSYTHRGKRATWRCNLHDCEFSRSVYELLSLRSTGCRGCAQAERAAKRQREGQDAATEERLALVAHGLGQRRADAYRLYTEGRTLAEIGRAFGVTREAVRQWLTAARKLLDTSG